ncbi:sulfurtransferase complex subunit TusD [Bisgaard Taxon 10/6]|uniref:Sulfurtransferase complex subunit TusD n=1 Tax=Exercitatus varius TaxID=67857 RepID=A0ABT6ETS3_9PAST|nr:sulfurtransferase complex subunit TusD [Exercitatus varius]MDG2916251.1 sulfurtransferase complex subunit TusD [Exercitatus varius]MDG2939937.1 sulfurtransferase complex subunit TusD [Exercitatus varius]MDG2943104.1 sulfurtransferase complex subunit TusD [Exercitatus varius]MDG2945392.1 sulfurtransferase complex subunit TusD [Exercitatus varius]MDG2947482.1 sulfurtransferase complex subunit TusD [Exercitatus varius]
MRYVIAVSRPVYGHQGAFTAYQLAVALLAAGHEITQVFFFQDGVTNGNAFVYPATDEFNLQKAWQKLSRDCGIPLHLCVSAGQRRGIVDNLTALNPELTNLADGFLIAGLGEFIRATLESERVITL